MVYHIEWLISGQVLLVTFEADLTDENLREMTDDLHARMTLGNAGIHVIVDIAAEYQFPTEINRLIPVAKRYYALPNLANTILVTDSLKLWMIGKVLSQICNRKQQVATTRTVQAALSYLVKKDNDLALSQATRVLAG